MKKTVALLEQEFESSCGLTPQFATFAKTFKRELKKELEESVGITEFDFHRGHFVCSGFFKTNDDRIFYFSQSDVRFFKENKLLVRTAKHFKDYTGGKNCYVPIGEHMFANGVLDAIR